MKKEWVLIYLISDHHVKRASDGQQSGAER